MSTRLRRGAWGETGNRDWVKPSTRAGRISLLAGWP